VGLGPSNEPENYSGGSVASGRAPIPDMSKVMTKAKRNTLFFQVGGGADNPTPNKICAVEKLLKFKKRPRSTKESDVGRRRRKRRRKKFITANGNTCTVTVTTEWLSIIFSRKMVCFRKAYITVNKLH